MNTLRNKITTAAILLAPAVIAIATTAPIIRRT